LGFCAYLWLTKQAENVSPAVMTIEELKKEVAEATEDLLKGNGIKHDDFMKEMKTWM
jgi:hypothetical protein